MGGKGEGGEGEGGGQWTVSEVSEVCNTTTLRAHPCTTLHMWPTDAALHGWGGTEYLGEGHIASVGAHHLNPEPCACA